MKAQVDRTVEVNEKWFVCELYFLCLIPGFIFLIKRTNKYV